MQVGGGNFLDASEFLALDRTVFCEIDLWPGQEIDANTACTDVSNLPHRLWHTFPCEYLNVLFQDATVIAGTFDLAEIHTFLSRQLTYRRTGVSKRKGVLVDDAGRGFCDGDRRGRCGRSCVRRGRGAGLRLRITGRERQDDRALADLVTY